jgi:membrane associated rhomboid family serine protease
MHEPERPCAIAAGESTPAVIRARSQRLAFDYSLVLLSQGIESTVLHDDAGWRLTLRPEEQERARSVLAQYRRENRGWAWRERLADAGAQLHWGALLWCFFLAFFYWWAEFGGAGLKSHGQMSNAAVREEGEWWRLFTAMTLHADLGHLAANLTAGFLTLGLAMNRWGAGVALLAAWFAGALGNGADLLLYSEAHRSLGASGMVMGGLGLLAVPPFRSLDPGSNRRRSVLRGLLGGMLLFVLLGLNPASDVVAHTGGFVVGVLLGFCLAALPQPAVRHPAANLVCGTALTGTAMLVWSLAWRP